MDLDLDVNDGESQLPRLLLRVRRVVRLALETTEIVIDRRSMHLSFTQVCDIHASLRGVRYDTGYVD